MEVSLSPSMEAAEPYPLHVRTAVPLPQIYTALVITVVILVVDEFIVF